MRLPAVLRMRLTRAVRMHLQSRGAEGNLWPCARLFPQSRGLTARGVVRMRLTARAC